MTYDYVDFRCGPSLNMVIGPNGTGKSTITCAIVLGLGWHPKVSKRNTRFLLAEDRSTQIWATAYEQELGRAPGLSQYVKTKTARGWIEITLKNSPGKPDITVKREINRHDQKSTWWINGQLRSFPPCRSCQC
jgi:chromosome segregation ATPase